MGTLLWAIHQNCTLVSLLYCYWKDSNFGCSTRVLGQANDWSDRFCFQIQNLLFWPYRLVIWCHRMTLCTWVNKNKVLWTSGFLETLAFRNWEQIFGDWGIDGRFEDSFVVDVGHKCRFWRVKISKWAIN